MDEVRPPRPVATDRKKRKRVTQYARCPHCWEHVAIPDDKDPDRIVTDHAKNDCWWVKKKGYFVHPLLRV